MRPKRTHSVHGSERCQLCIRTIMRPARSRPNADHFLNVGLILMNVDLLSARAFNKSISVAFLWRALHFHSLRQIRFLHCVVVPNIAQRGWQYFSNRSRAARRSARATRLHRRGQNSKSRYKRLHRS